MESSHPDILSGVLGTLSHVEKICSPASIFSAMGPPSSWAKQQREEVI